MVLYIADLHALFRLFESTLFLQTPLLALQHLPSPIEQTHHPPSISIIRGEYLDLSQENVNARGVLTFHLYGADLSSHAKIFYPCSHLESPYSSLP